MSYVGEKCKSNKLCIIELAFGRDEHDLALNPIGQAPDLHVIFLEKALFSEQHSLLCMGLHF